MKKNNNTVITVIQVILWAALAAVFLCMLLLDGNWQTAVAIAIASTLGYLHKYKKDPEPKNPKQYFIACGVTYVVLAVIYFIFHLR
jgi:uncharacterized membrane protein YjjP (DUF1212 family)